MVKLANLKQLLMKEETVEGQDSAPTGADVMLVEELNGQPEQESIPASPIAASQAKEFSAPTRTRSKVTVKMRVRGSGEVADPSLGLSAILPNRPPRNGRLLQSAGMRETRGVILYFNANTLTPRLTPGTKIHGTISAASARIIVRNATEGYLLCERINPTSFAPNEPLRAGDDPNTGTIIGTLKYDAGVANGLSVQEGSYGFLYRPCSKTIQKLTLDNTVPSGEYGTSNFTNWKAAGGRFGSICTIHLRGLISVLPKGTKVEGLTSGAYGTNIDHATGQILVISAAAAVLAPGTVLRGSTTGATAIVRNYVPISGGASTISVRRQTAVNFAVAEQIIAVGVGGWGTPTITTIGNTRVFLNDVSGTFRGGEQITNLYESKAVLVKLNAATAVATIPAGTVLTGASSGASWRLVETAAIGATYLHVFRLNAKAGTALENISGSGLGTAPVFLSEASYQIVALTLAGTPGAIPVGKEIDGATSLATAVTLEDKAAGTTTLYVGMTAGTFSAGEVVNGTGLGGPPSTGAGTPQATFRPEIESIEEYLDVTALNAGLAAGVPIAGGTSTASAVTVLSYLSGATELWVQRTTAADFTVGEAITGTGSAPDPTLVAKDHTRNATPKDGFLIKGGTSGAYGVVRTPYVGGHFVHDRGGTLTPFGVNYAGGGVGVLPVETDQTVLYFEPSGYGQFVAGEEILDALTGVAIKKTSTTLGLSYYQRKPYSTHTYRDGVRTKSVGMRANITFDLPAGKQCFLTAEMGGSFLERKDSPLLPNPDYGDTGLFLRVSSWDSFQEAPTANISLTLGAVLGDREGEQAPEGLVGTTIGDRDPVLKVDPETTLVVQRDWTTLMREATSGLAANARYFDSKTAAGSRFVIFAPNTQVVAVVDGERNSHATDEVELHCRREHVLGDDELVIWFS